MSKPILWPEDTTALMRLFNEWAKIGAIKERTRLIQAAKIQHRSLDHDGSIHRCYSEYCDGMRDALDIGSDD